MLKVIGFFAFCTAVALPQTTVFAATTDWLQFGFDPTHSEINPYEAQLSPQSVQYLHLKYSKTLSAPVLGAPVLLTGVATSQGVKDVLYLTINDGTLLALDAATGAQIWVQSPPSVPTCAGADQSPPCLVASSPAIDPNRTFVYSYSRLDGKIHKYAVANGAETIDAHWPEVSTLKPNVENGSSALAFATTVSDGKTYLYMTHSSIKLNDSGDYQGHITAIELASGNQIVFNAVCADQGNKHFVESGATTGANQNDCMQQTFNDGTAQVPDGSAGIWGRAAATYDPANDSIYVSTGNGVYDPSNAQGFGSNWSDSVLRLPAAMSSELFAPLDNYTPANYMQLMMQDNDMGSTSVALIPTSLTQNFAYKHLGIQSGKDSNVRIIDLDNLGITTGPFGSTDSMLYIHGVPQGNEVKTQPLVWLNPNGAIMIIIVNDFGASAMQLTMDGSNNPQLSHSTASAWKVTGTNLSHGTTAGGASPVIANGVLYYAGASGLTALDPATGNILVTRSEMGVSGTSPGNIHKQSPIVVNGRVYITDENAKLWVYDGDDIFNDGFE